VERNYLVLNEDLIPTTDSRDEIRRIAKVSDMLCTGHAYLRDQYQTRALLLDLLVLLSSTWLVALAFVSPDTAKPLAPRNIDPMLWIGVLGVFTFALSIVQSKVDWKGRSDAHQRSFEIYAEVKGLAHHMPQHDNIILKTNCNEVLVKYDLAALVGIHITEKEFLKAKKRHKVEGMAEREGFNLRLVSLIQRNQRLSC